MVIYWSNFAKENLKQFLEITKLSNPIKYIENLVNYTDNLIDNNYMGKHILTVSTCEIRQLIYKKYKILYTFENNEIKILSVIHSSQNYSEILKMSIEQFVQLIFFDISFF